MEGNMTWANSSVEYGNASSTEYTPAPTYGYLSTSRQLLITLSYVIGVVGNSAALLILCRPRRQRNRRHNLMLRCLACNDLVALLGMLVQMYLNMYLPARLLSDYWTCVARVFWRLFGLGSGCVAGVMAVDRWLALTHPFLYQKHVTYQIIRRAIFSLWGAVLVLVCLPFTGFGLYYHTDHQRCVRYRMARETKDVAYAYLFFTFDLYPPGAVRQPVVAREVLLHHGRHSNGSALHPGPLCVCAAAPPEEAMSPQRAQAAVQEVLS